MSKGNKMSLAEFREFVEEPEVDYYVGIEGLRELIGLENDMDWHDYIKAVVMEGEECYACCKDECRTEPDGYCEHGCPSVLIMMGLI